MVPWLQRYEGHLFASSPMNPITAREFALEGLRHLKNSVSLLSLMGKKAPW
jgi:hypothetical protein